MLIRWSTHDREGSVFGRLGGAVLRRVGAVLVWLFATPRPRRLGLFEFHDGTRRRYADAVEAWRALQQAAGRGWTDTLASLDSDDPPPGAAELLAGAAVTAFGVRAHSDGPGSPPGMTTAARVRLVARFFAYMVGEARHCWLTHSLVSGAVKVRTRPPAPPAVPTVPVPPPEPTHDA